MYLVLQSHLKALGRDIHVSVCVCVYVCVCVCVRAIGLYAHASFQSNFLNQSGVIGEAHTQCTKYTPYIMTQCLGYIQGLYVL